ncbi:MAG: START-like domain-containing protein [Chitinophagales bacterium]|nr:START-like domain-containing protein [Chitinophagales bacterium]MDW8272928.1 START-like domain-containing protein [Chitinophagales bacterium]
MARKKFTLEYIIRSSPAILFEFVTEPSALAQWFADYCDAQDNNYIFGWSGQYERAKLLEIEDEEFVKYKWLKSPDNEYFSFRVYKSEISFETVLEITDFAEEKEMKDAISLWDKQIEDLKHAIGAS